MKIGWSLFMLEKERKVRPLQTKLAKEMYWYTARNRGNNI